MKGPRGYALLFVLPIAVSLSFVHCFTPRVRCSTRLRASSLKKDGGRRPLGSSFLQSTQRDGTSFDNEDNDNSVSNGKKRPKFVVVGGGWAGWGAAKALCESGCDADVTLIDVQKDPTGQTIMRSKSGKPVEPGTRGFWKDYPNIYALCDELGLSQDNVFTEYTNSSFYSPDGLEATAPVFDKVKIPSTNLPFLSSLSGESISKYVPSPLGQVLATFPLFERIPLSDRASMVGLLVAVVDCFSGDESVQEQYDRMTAHDLFIRFGLSQRLVDDFVKPTLLVGLFKPPEELSALVAMELLYYYALAHVDSFDVRWIKRGTVGSSLLSPLANHLQQTYNMTVRGGCRVTTISVKEDDETTSKHRPVSARNKQPRYQVKSLEFERWTTANNETGGSSSSSSPSTTKYCWEDVDGIVLALSSRGMQSVVGKSPDLAGFPAFARAATCPSIDVISTRLWFNKTIPTRTPANVFSKFDELRGAGGTFFMLDQLQNTPEALQELWGDDDNDTEPKGSVVAADFYNAGALIHLSDEELVRLLVRDLLPSAVPEFASVDCAVVDFWVGRYPASVSWFAPGTYAKRPPLHGAGRDTLYNIKCAGDWVRMGEYEHGAKGLCQERAYVSGIQAANALLKDYYDKTKEANNNNNKKKMMQAPRLHEVLPVREDQIQFRAALEINQRLRTIFPRTWIR